MTKMIAKALSTITTTRLYTTGPHKLQPADIPGFQPPPEDGAETSTDALNAHGWFLHDEEPGRLRGFEEGMRAIADAIEAAGGVDGVLGFSQGGAVAALVAAAMEGDAAGEGEGEWVGRLRGANGGRRLRFCVVYSGFEVREGAGLGWLYAGGIKTPSCHFFGSMDEVVDEARCRGLAGRFVGAEEVVHPGGHHVPVRKEWVAPLIGFLKRVLDEDEALAAGSGA